MKLIIVLALVLTPLLSQAGVRDDISKIDKSLLVCLAKGDSASIESACYTDALTQADSILASKTNLAQIALQLSDDSYHVELSKRFLSSQKAFEAYRGSNSSFAGAETTVIWKEKESAFITSKAYNMTKERILESERSLDLL